MRSHIFSLIIVNILIFCSNQVLSQNVLRIHQNGAVMELNHSQFLGQTLPDVPLIQTVLIKNSGNSVLRVTDLKFSNNLKIRNKYFEVPPGDIFQLFVEFSSDNIGFYTEYIAFRGNQIRGNDFIELEVEVIDEKLMAQETPEQLERFLEIDFSQPEEFNKVRIGESAQYRFKVKNVGYRSIYINELACTKGFSLNADAMVIRPGQSVEMTLQFFPHLTGLWKGAARIKCENEKILRILNFAAIAVWGYEDEYLDQYGIVIPPDPSDNRLIINLGKINLQNYDIILADKSSDIVWQETITRYQAEQLCIPIVNIRNGLYSVNVVDNSNRNIVFSQEFRIN